MKKDVQSVLRIFLMGLLLLPFCIGIHAEGLVRKGFVTPPDQVKMHTWWHWLDGNITKDGITKDLEAMKAQGIVQATILNVGLFADRDFGVKKVNFNSPEWFDMFQWALKEADRLGISIGAHNCDGWSTSGGPWITPELSMKRTTWTKTIVDASDKGALRLKQPLASRNFYKDVAVVAIRTKETLNSFQKAAPTVILPDGSNAPNVYDGCQVSAYTLARGGKMTFRFAANHMAEKIVLLPRRSFMWGDPDKFTSTYTIAVSDDGKTFKKWHEFTLTGLNKVHTVEFPKTSARFYQLTLVDTNRIDDYIPVTIAECELLPMSEMALFSPEIEYFSEKTGDLKAARAASFNPATTNSGVNAEREVKDLTSFLKADGTLDWKPSEGRWAILRFGYTTTEAMNGPATAAGTGLECDKMDTAALNLHFKSFPARMIEKAGAYAGNTFKFMLIDSWECGYQNWTAAFPSEFQKRRGYSLIPYIPVLCGVSSGSVETDEAVLYDVRKTIGELIENNYYKHFSDLLHEKKIELHAEVIYGNGNYPALDILRTTQYVDLPMYEFWSTTDDNLNLKYNPMKGVELNMPSCAAIGYEKPVMASEAYTGMAHYCESPAGLKPFGNSAYCTGINQMILHSYVHQPNDKKPGMTLGQFGSHFNRNNTYWPYLSEWFTFQGRVQYILQQGVAHHDVLYYLGDQLPQYLEYNEATTLPFGYMMNSCNYDILQNRIEVKDGKIVLNGKTSYAMLSLPVYTFMSYESLKRIAELVEQGATVYGPKPMQMFSMNDLKNNKKQFEELTIKLWGKDNGQSATVNSYGKGKVYGGMPIAEALKKHEILPDLSTGMDDSKNLIFIHKKMGNQDVYFVANQQNSELRRELSFRVTGKTPEILDPEYGTSVYPGVYAIDDQYTTLPVTLKPYESLIFVFNDQKPREYVQAITQKGKQLFPSTQKETLEVIPTIVSKNGILVCLSASSNDLELTTHQQKSFKLMTARVTEYVLNDFSGKVEFEPAYTASVAPVNIKELNWLTETDNADLKYFSGTAKYTLSFSFPTAEIASQDSVMLDLGDFESVAAVKLNGKSLGILWDRGKLISVKGLVKESNVLEVTVANTFRNRFIGDFMQHGKVQNIWTSSPIQDFLSKERPLEPSGLKGPIRIISMSRQVQQ